MVRENEKSKECRYSKRLERVFARPCFSTPFFPSKTVRLPEFRASLLSTKRTNLGTGPGRSSTYPPPTILKRTTRVRVASTTTTANNNNNDNNSRSGESSSGIVGENSFEPSRSRSFHDKPAFETWIGNFSLPNNI